MDNYEKNVLLKNLVIKLWNIEENQNVFPSKKRENHTVILEFVLALSLLMPGENGSISIT